VLVIRASPRPNGFSNRVTDHFLQVLNTTQPGVRITEWRLHDKLAIPEFGQDVINGKMAEGGQADALPGEHAAWSQALDVIREFKEADAYVVAAPMWNFGIPAKLKNLVDVLSHSGHTFENDESGESRGLLLGKRALLVCARAGAYPADSQSDFQLPYLRKVFGVMGVEDQWAVAVESTWKGQSSEVEPMREAAAVAQEWCLASPLRQRGLISPQHVSLPGSALAIQASPRACTRAPPPRSVLVIRASPRPDGFSNRVTDHFLQVLNTTQPGVRITEWRLHDKLAIPEFGQDVINGKMAEGGQADALPGEHAAWSQALDVIREFKEADAYVVAAPMWNFGIPAKLKNLVDVLSHSGHTFENDESGESRGLLLGKRALLVCARAGAYPADSQSDFQLPYLRKVFGVMGVEDQWAVAVESTWKGPSSEVEPMREAAAVAQEWCAPSSALSHA